MKKHKKLNVTKSVRKIGIRFRQLAPDFGEGIIPDCKIQLLFNSAALVEGCRGIAEYDEGRISLNSSKGLVMFSGERLSLERFEDNDVVIKGKITAVEFMT